MSNFTLTIEVSESFLCNARKWLIECYPEEEEEILEADDQQVLRAVNRLYDGGLRAFIMDTN